MSVLSVFSASLSNLSCCTFETFGSFITYIQGAVASEWRGHSDHSMISGLDQEEFCGTQVASDHGDWETSSQANGIVKGCRAAHDSLWL